ncbi:ABC transporter substrate-binding protein [Mycolicibacterium thermoresistibile]
MPIRGPFVSRPIRFGLAALLTASSLIGCATAQHRDSPTLAADAALPTSVPEGTTLVVADDANRLKTLLTLSGEQDRLTAEVSYANFSSGPLRLEAIRSGNAQLGYAGDVPPILAHYSDADVPIVGAVRRDGAGALIVTSPGSGITSLPDLAGNRIGINEGTSQQAILLRNLKAAGLSIGDIEPVNLGLAEFADGLRANQIQAAVLKQPDRSRYLDSTADSGTVEIPSAPGANPGLNYLYAGRTALADPAQAAAIREFVIAWYRAELWRNANPDVWISEYLVNDQHVSIGDARSIVESDGLTTVPGFTDEVVATQQETIDLLQEAGAFTGRELNARDEFDFRFADLTADSPTETRGEHS